MGIKRPEELVEEKARSLVENTELEVVDVEYVKEKDWYLRIFIDKKDGVDLEDCQFVSKAISDWLDEVDPIPGAYHLEVSSPGLDRPLKREKDLERNIGNMVEVGFFAPWEGEKKWVGSLDGFDQEYLFLQLTDRKLEIPRKLIAQIRRSLD